MELIEEKLNKLLDWFRSRGAVLVAFSGGVDSSVVAKLARISSEKSLAVTANSSTLAPWELQEARKIAQEIGIQHLIIDIDELRNPDFARNPINRCYYCKKELACELKKLASELGFETIVDGTNASDLEGHRPGFLALKEEGIFSPLAEFGITKQDSRKLAELLGLSVANKPSMACLASRIPYGQQITLEKLRRIAEAEAYIRKRLGANQVRVRDHDGIARIELGRDERRLVFNEDILDEIHRELRKLGFRYVTLDLLGYRSGSLDEFLK